MADPAVGYDGNPIGPTNGGTPGSGFNVKDLAALGSLAPLIINMLKGSSQPNPGALLGTLPGGQDLLNGVVGQQQQQAPLRQAVTQQAMNMLPNSAYPGGRPTLAPVGPGAAPVPGGGGTDWGKLLGAGAAGAGLGALLSKLASGSGGGSGGPLGPIAKALWGLIHHGGPTNQGNKPYPGGALPGGNQTPFTGWDPSVSDPGGKPYLTSDPGVYYGESGGGANPTDPSGGTGTGPGMQDYYGGGGFNGGGGGGGDGKSSTWDDDFG